MSDPIRFDNNIIVNGDSQPSTGPSTGTLIVNGGVTINNTTEATSSTNGGALTILGGFACAKDIVSGGTIVTEYLTVNNNITITGNITATGTITSIGETQPSSVVTPGSITSTLASGTGLTITADAVILGSLSPGTIIGSPVSTLGATSTGALSPTSIVGSPSATLGTVSTEALSSTSLSLSGGLTITGVSTFNNYQELTGVTAPGNASSGKVNLYLDSADLLLKSKNNAGVITTFSPSTTKGDLISHNGTTQTRFPVSSYDNRVIKSDSTASSGLGWVPGVSVSSSDKGSAYYEQYDGLGYQSIGVFPVWSDIMFNVDRINSPDYFTSSNGIVTFLQSQPYAFIYRLAVNSIASNSTIQTRVMIDPGTGTFAELEGTRGGVFCGSTGERAGQIEYNTCIYPSVNYRIKIQATEITSSGTVKTIPDSGILSITRFFVKNSSEDTSQFVSVYNNSTPISLSSTFIDIPMDGNYIVNSRFSFTNGGTEITLNSPGGFFIFGKFGFQNTSASDNDTQVQVQLVANYGAGYSTVPDSIANIVVSKATVTGYKTGVTLGAVGAPPGTKIKMQAKIVSGGGTISLLPSGNNITILSLTTSDTGFAVKTAGFTAPITSTTVQSSFTDLALNTASSFTDTSFYVHTSPNAHVTITQDGIYNFIALANFSNGNSNPGTVRMRLSVDNNDNNGFNPVHGSTSIVDISPNLISFCQSSMFYFIPAGGKIKIQAIVSSGTPSVTTSSVRLAMARVNILNLPTEGLVPFGSNVQYSKGNGIYSTVSLTNVSAFQFATNYINAGNYLIQWNYQSKSIGGIGISLFLDSVEVDNDTNNVAISTYSGNTGTYIGYMNPGIHTIELAIRSLTVDSMCSVTLPKLIVYRIS